MKKEFTLKLWKKCLGDIYKKTTVKRFFSYVDIIQVLIDGMTIYLFAPNSHIKVIVEKYYYNKLLINIHKLTGSCYKVEFKIGLIYIDPAKKISIRFESFKSFDFDDLMDGIIDLSPLHLYKSFFVYINIKFDITAQQRRELALDLVKNKFAGAITSLNFLLKQEVKLNNILAKNKLFILIEKDYDYKFYLQLNKNIDKIRKIVENSSIIFVSKLSLSTLKEIFLNIVK